jgi:hypothetical protein
MTNRPWRAASSTITSIARCGDAPRSAAFLPPEKSIPFVVCERSACSENGRRIVLKPSCRTWRSMSR